MLLTRTRRFTVDEYYRMAEAGILGPDERVELLDGEILDLLPIGSRHAGVTSYLANRLIRALRERVLVMVQCPLRIDEHDEPQPDIAVLKPRDDDYRGQHPGPRDAYLVIEVAESSIERDRFGKLPLYAKAKVPEFWLVDLVRDRIEVHRSPIQIAYDDITVLAPGQPISPEAFPDIVLAVGDILGKKA